MKIYDAIIIGAGASGLMAAVTAGERGRRILLLEKTGAPGKKLLISGNGQCNITNAEPDADKFLGNFSSTGQFLRNAFHIFSNKDLIKYFESNGISFITEGNKKVFPESRRASDILKVLVKNLTKAGVQLKLNAPVTEIKKNDKNTFSVKTDKDIFYSQKVLIATGGLSYPETGSDGFGFAAAEKLGHTVTPASPSLVGINIKSVPKTWQGISLNNIFCKIVCGEKNFSSSAGDIIFTHFGASGPAIFDLSSDIYLFLKTNKNVNISIDFIPSLNYHTLENKIMKEFKISPNKNIESVVKKVLPQKMASGLINFAKVPPQKKINQITKPERDSLISALKNFVLPVKSTRPIEEATVTRGGVSVKEINPKTMESKIVPGLFFSGEVIDIDGKTGGFNLQAAFSTGFAAGLNI